MKTLEQKAWELKERGYDYGDIASYAITHNLESMDDAIREMWAKEND